ncbi:MAG: GNAT family N-acetyltransferase [Alphaproteobacteria bacterium]|nr:GNAT family N-acetyltransferase [Alphaproteobacteria bacterium]
MASTAATLAEPDFLEARPGERREWDQLLRQAGQSSLEQSWSYGDAVAGHSRAIVTRRIIQCGDRPAAMVQGFRTRDLKLGSINRILRGPVWLDAPTADRRLDVCRAIRRDFRQRPTDLLFWLPEMPDTGDSARLMRTLGMRRMVTGYSTVWLDIRPDEDRLRSGLRGKWRNSLVVAEKGNLRVRAATNNRAFDAAMAAYDRFRRNQRFIGPPADLIRHMHDAAGKADTVRVWLAMQGKEPAAGIVVIRHGASATYLAGWTTDEGRDGNAHNLLLWRAITELRKAGTDWLDLGGVDTQTAPGIARFKLGLGGELQTNTGTFL